MWDDDLLKMATQLASSQVITNSIAASNTPGVKPAMVNEKSMVKLVSRYYQELKTNFPNI